MRQTHIAGETRFAELEGVPDWHLHATMIEVAALDAEPIAPTRGK